MPSFATGFVSKLRGRVRARLLVYILSAVCGDLGSNVLTRTCKLTQWKAFGNRTTFFILQAGVVCSNFVTNKIGEQNSFSIIQWFSSRNTQEYFDFATENSTLKPRVTAAVILILMKEQEMRGSMFYAYKNNMKIGWVECDGRGMWRRMRFSVVSNALIEK